MSDHKGLPWILIAVVCVVASIFFLFYDTGTLSTSGLNQLEFLFTQFSVYTGVWQSVLADFMSIFASIPDFVFFVFILLAPPFLLIGTVVLLFGLTGRTLSGIGAFLLIVAPIVYVVCVVILPVFSGGNIAVTITYLQPGFYLQLIGAILGFVGSAKNKHED
jgi:hypothetical protein